MSPVPDDRSFERSSELQARLHELVPGGAHTYARGSDRYLEHMTPVLVRGHGCRMWDADGNDYVACGMGLRSVTLGHGFRPVIEAVCSAIANGVNFTRPTVLVLAAAEDFLAPNPARDRVRFAFRLPGTDHFALDVLDVQGQRVWSRKLQARAAEQFEWGWALRDADGRRMAPGGYTSPAFAATPARSRAA